MLKNFLYFAVITLALESLCFAADLVGDLKTANHEYMALVQGSTSGILDTKGTPEQLRQMIDGCITVGITDRLYGNAQRPMASINALTPQKKLHVLLAYAFYALGFYNWNSSQEAQAGLLHLGVNVKTEPNFDREYTILCRLAFDKSTIYQYKDNLEDVIKRTAKGLNFDDFIEERFYEVGEMQEIPKTCQSLYTLLDRSHGPSTLSDALTQLCPEFKRKYVGKGTAQPDQAANPSPSPVIMTSQAPSPLIVASAGGGHDLTAPSQLAADAALKDVGFPSKAIFTQAGNRAEDFEKYAKMLKILPLGAVKQKMQQEGVIFPSIAVPTAAPGGDDPWSKTGYYNKSQYLANGGDISRFDEYKSDADSGVFKRPFQIKTKYGLK